VEAGRSYNQYCGVAHALDLIGERWALLVVRELVLGPKRFTDLRGGLPHIATNVLSQRLRQLERDGIITRRQLRPPAASTVYELTDYGQELVPVMLDLGRWGARTIGPRREEQAIRSEWLAVALRAFFDPESAADLEARIRLDLDGDDFILEIAGGELQIHPGLDGEADLGIAGDTLSLIAFLGGAPASLETTGDPALLERFRAAFPLRAG
jgi:DNA-binding HxlR family transcriptional regulator